MRRSQPDDDLRKASSNRSVLWAKSQRQEIALCVQRMTSHWGLLERNMKCQRWGCRERLAPDHQRPFVPCSVLSVLNVGIHCRCQRRRGEGSPCCLPPESSCHSDGGIRQKCRDSFFNQHADRFCFCPGHTADKVIIIEESWEALDTSVERATRLVWMDQLSVGGDSAPSKS